MELDVQVLRHTPLLKSSWVAALMVRIFPTTMISSEFDLG